MMGKGVQREALRISDGAEYVFVGGEDLLVLLVVESDDEGF